MEKKLSVVVMSGGSGTRLWPLSRKLLPKQFLKLTDFQNTMFQISCLNANKLNPEEFIIVCNEQHKFLASQQLEELNIHNYKIICEPFGKNTAAAISIACSVINQENDIFVMTSDHVWDSEELCNSIIKAKKINDNQNILVFGIKPTYPETGYGYINYENNSLIEFVEKPNLEKAKEYINDNYLWNSGNFFFTNSYMINQLEKYAFDVINNVRLTLKNSNNQNKIISLNSEYFDKVPEISIDYAVMEKQEKGIVIKYDGFWADIGSLLSLHNFKDKDNNDNVKEGDIYTIDTRNCFIKSEERLVTTLNIENLAIVDTKDVLLVADINRSQDVKLFVKQLEKEKREEIVCHSKVFRPWGWYKNIEGTDLSGFKVKRIGVYPGKKLSLQSHNYRSEHWVIVKGKAKVQVGKDFLILNENQHVYIPKETLHRMENIGEEELEFVETQIGSYLGEDDIIRYEDDFGRK
jgi:mannose-1-phosphate guanylyltransferase/mannose-6-phosphate isomerase